MKRFYIVTCLILPILTACSSAVKKDPIFYSDNKRFIIPLCPNKGALCVDPTDLQNRSIEPRPIEGNIYNYLSDFGTVIGEIEVFYSPGGGYLDSTQPFYIIHEENVGNLYLHKSNAQLRDHFLKKSIIVMNNKQKEVTEYFHLAGESDGFLADIDLYNFISSNNGAIFAVKLKNISNIKKTFNTSTDKICLFLKDAKTKKKIEIQLYLYNYCSNSSLSYIKDIEPGEEREYFAITKFGDESENGKIAGMQVTLALANELINGLAFGNRDNTFKKYTDDINAVWGGSVQIEGKTVLLEPKILIKTITPR